MESEIKLTKFIEISDLVWRYVWCGVSVEVCVVWCCLYSFLLLLCCRWGKSKFTIKFKFQIFPTMHNCLLGCSGFLIRVFERSTQKWRKVVCYSKWCHSKWCHSKWCHYCSSHCRFKDTTVITRKEKVFIQTRARTHAHTHTHARTHARSTRAHTAHAHTHGHTHTVHARARNTHTHNDEV